MSRAFFLLFVKVKVDRNLKENSITLKSKKILITGAAGFIGSNLVLELFYTVPDVTIIEKGEP